MGKSFFHILGVQQVKIVQDAFLRRTEELDRRLGVGRSFDMVGRSLTIGGRRARLWVVNGYADDAVLERAVAGWLATRFMLLTLVAVVLATPACAWLMRRYLQDFRYVIPFPWYLIPLSALLLLLVALLSILWQTWRAASENPVETLRSNE